MRFEEDDTDRLIGVAILTESDDVMMATRNGKAIRFSATDVREFQSRTSTGVRGITLKDGDEVISLSILRGFEATTEEREEYLRAAPWKDNDAAPTLSAERMAEFAAAEEFILTVCANGYGKRSSAYEYRRTGRGGQGITNIDNLARNGPVVASFPAHNGEQLILVTDQAKLIRMMVGDTRVIGRNSAGVRLFNVADDEHVVGAARIEESEEEAEADLRTDADMMTPDVATPDDGTIGDDLADGSEGDDVE
jgi:DNA gyrase subunit A